MTEIHKPKVTNSLAEKELDKAQKQFENFDSEIKEMTMDRMNKTPQREVEPQTKIAQSDLAKSKDIYLKPARSIGSTEKFNERFRSDYEFSTEIVNFIAENKECMGETAEFWTKPYPGMPCQFWQVPTNKAVWGPRHVAERLRGCKHHTIIMQARGNAGSDQYGNQYQGQLTIDTEVQRLDAYPVSSRKSVFMGQSEFKSNNMT